MSIQRKIMLAIAPVALIALGGCTTNFKADVSRFQAMPVPEGQTFSIVALDPEMNGGLEFSQYASLVSAHLAQAGYRPADAGSDPTLVVKLDYGVDKGREKIRSYPSYGYGAGWYGNPGYWGPYRRWGRYGYVPGFYDPFMYGGFGYNDIESYTVYTSGISMMIERKADGQRVFEGKAQAVSSTNKLTYLVPNLIEAMFTGFPGNSGETVKITVPPPPKS
ncbi:DUF4136 domain-containing protein [Sphingomonas sp. LaA6.9]|uniref:DUF4136 domain-containing protein n=1 Tax=Sphingomonas sp. LaA6.9 TaxID=2919914 RepID=UPI001F4F3114|nr:DUF4136 domain-containing protein [Sphingomonas sp. LaA6.9]MCJ8157451.1 DUF4136 domain-containing protein [Sphingomonas sp. LaA6.9]